MTDTDGPSPARVTGDALHRFFRDRFGSPAAIYGLILYTAAIGTISIGEEDLDDIAVEGLLSLLIFFTAHVFAHTVADHGRLSLGQAIRHGVTHSAGCSTPRFRRRPCS